MQTPMCPPASIAMLDSVMRSSMDIASTDGSGKFDHPVRGAVHREPPDYFKNDVLGIHAPAELPVDRHPDGRWLTKGTNSLENADFEVRGADARGKRAERAVRAGVAVAHDHGIARPYETLSREKRMADAVFADVEKVFDMCAGRPTPGAFSPVSHSWSPWPVSRGR
jgi:hypothetical protein